MCTQSWELLVSSNEEGGQDLGHEHYQAEEDKLGQREWGYKSKFQELASKRS